MASSLLTDSKDTSDSFIIFLRFSLIFPDYPFLPVILTILGKRIESFLRDRLIPLECLKLPTSYSSSSIRIRPGSVRSWVYLRLCWLVLLGGESYSGD